MHNMKDSLGIEDKQSGRDEKVNGKKCWTYLREQPVKSIAQQPSLKTPVGSPEYDQP